MYPSRKHIFAQGLPKNQQKKKQPFGPLGPLALEPPATPQLSAADTTVRSCSLAIWLFKQV